MSESSQAEPGPSSSRGRGRGSHKSRGGLGKYLRARGRGGGRGRPAVFQERLLLEGEQNAELDEEEVQELQQKFSRRQLGTNADRYAEPEPELDSEGEEIVEPEVDLSSFLERQRLSEGQPHTTIVVEEEDDSDIDTSLALHGLTPQAVANSKKGKVQQIEWDESLETLRREKANADATRELKERFRARTAAQRGRGTTKKPSVRTNAKDKEYVDAPALPTDTPKPEKSDKQNMEEFLDDLLG
ncbi:hypothetical protein QCA50_016184 [Cerrena zonata]|uniref:Uncharacterized protein n=1 Tax=Cerrena zonata TaxID=2478898 RepID=A0AAW0FRL0_9APHY